MAEFRRVFTLTEEMQERGVAEALAFKMAKTGSRTTRYKVIIRL